MKLGVKFKDIRRRGLGALEEAPTAELASQNSGKRFIVFWLEVKMGSSGDSCRRALGRLLRNGWSPISVWHERLGLAGSDEGKWLMGKGEFWEKISDRGFGRLGSATTIGVLQFFSGT
jgi:hypothetical protein